MNFSDFAALLTLDVDAIIALAGFLSVGIFSLVQTLKVLNVLKDSAQTGRVALLTSAVYGAVVVASYYFPNLVPVFLLLYSVQIAVSAAAMGYKYLASPILKKLFPTIELSSDELNGE